MCLPEKCRDWRKPIFDGMQFCEVDEDEELTKGQSRLTKLIIR